MFGSLDKYYTAMLNISFPPGSVGIRIPKMLELFKYGHEYFVESDCYIRTQIATVRLIKRTHEDQILANS